MDKLGIASLTNREIYYISTHTPNWVEQLPKQDWLVLLITENKDNDLFDQVIHGCLEGNVNYICTLGEYCEYAHDRFDEEIVLRRIRKGESIESTDDFEGSPMTTWHENFGEGFWFALISAFNGVSEIKKVVCLDLTKHGCANELSELLSKINHGWLPDD